MYKMRVRIILFVFVVVAVLFGLLVNYCIGDAVPSWLPFVDK